MIKILFVCHGNICRSPMAEFIMKDIVLKNKLSDEFIISSCATSYEEIGNSIYPPAKRKLYEHSISFSEREARLIEKADYEYYDYIIAMDRRNLKNLTYHIGEDKDNKIFLLMDFTNNPKEVSDPWYTGDFEATYQDITKGCEALFDKLCKNAD